MSFVAASMVLCFRFVTEAVLITSDVLVVAEQYLHTSRSLLLIRASQQRGLVSRQLGGDAEGKAGLRASLSQTACAHQ